MLVALLVVQPKHSGDFMSMVLETDFTGYFLCMKHLLFCCHFIGSLRAVRTTSCMGVDWFPSLESIGILDACC